MLLNYKETYCFTGLINCLMDARCESRTIGTTQEGNQLKGKYKTAMSGWSKANF
jgi:hypothetical protein